MLQLKLAIRLASLKQPFKKALHTAAKMGVGAVEIDARRELRPAELTQTAIRHIRKLLDELNLRVSAIAYPTRRGYEVTDDLQPRIEGTRQAMRMAFQLGADCVVNHLGQIWSREENALARDTLRQSLVELARFGDREGAHLAALTGGASPEEIALLREELPEATLHLAIDPGEAVINSVDPCELVQRTGCPIRYVYATDGVTDVARGRGMEVSVGRGIVDFPALFGCLEERGYHGYVCIRRANSEQPLPELSDAMEYLKTIFV